MKSAAAVFALLLAACAAESDPGDEGREGPDAGADLLPFMSECTLGADDACETGICFDFNTKGPHCTHACEVDADCEDPSPGCNGMGVCKAPGGGDGTGDGG